MAWRMLIQCDSMRTRWLKWLPLALLASACFLNPQPDVPLVAEPNVPGSNAGGAQGQATAGASHSGGTGGYRQPADGNAAGGFAIGDGGDQGASAGDSGESEAGAAGADQLAPGPAR